MLKMERGQSMGGGEKSWVSMWCDGGAWKAEHFVMWTNSLKSWHKWNWSNFSKEIFDFRKMASCAWNLLYPKTQFEASKNRTFLHHSDQILWQAKKKPDSPTHFLPEEIESGNLASKEGTSAFSAQLHHLWTRARGGRDLRGGGIPFFLWDWKIRQVAQNSRSVCKCWGLLRWVRLARRWAKTGRERSRWMKGGTYKFG